MLLLSTLVVSPAAFVANAAEQYGITVNHIFSDGYNADSSYDELYGTYEVGTTPLVTIDAPYGYLIWRGKYNSFRADGKDGQLCIVLPDYNAVITTVSECKKPDELMKAIYEELCPQL